MDDHWPPLPLPVSTFVVLQQPVNCTGKEKCMPGQNGYKHLESRPGSNYKQLFVKGRRIRAEVLYRQTIGPEPRSLQEVADDYDLPVEVVQDAVDYCAHHQHILQEDRDRECANVQADEQQNPHLLPPSFPAAS
jgi:uncharacterized protein (DUF433 family)